MKKIILLIVLLSIPSVLAICAEDQIDINTAPKEKLVEIVYIGDVRAEELITLRLFSSVDELTRIKGIGEIYLSKIKEQGLACVNITEEPKNETGGGEPEDKPLEEETGNEPIEEEEDNEPMIVQNINLDTINLKSENDKESLNKNYAIYILIALCILVIILLLVKKDNKNEFM